MKTLIAIPCLDMVPVGFVKSLLMIQRNHDTGISLEPNSLVYDTRNRLSLHAIENGYDRVFWLDSDMIVMPDALQRLSDVLDGTGNDIVSGLYFKRTSPTLPVIYSKVEEPAKDASGRLTKRIREYKNYPEQTIFPVRGCGMGCCLTSVKLLKDVWDNFGPAFSPYPWAGEDISFCHRVNELGYTILCDSRVQCGHIGTHVFSETDYNRRGDADANEKR